MSSTPHTTGRFPEPRLDPYVARLETDRQSAPGRESEEPPERRRWQVNLVLFIATLLSVFFMGVLQSDPPPLSVDDFIRALPNGWLFAVPLMSILVVHEFGHYIAARSHRVDASLPYFLPLPVLSPFGTMGAVIAMRGRIRSRNALLDIGASGPLAGLFVAIPVLAIGLSQSVVGPQPASGYMQEGQSLLYVLLKYVVLGPMPDGYDVRLHPTAFAGWAGLLVTMINLLPWGQLDGGHVAYALFGARQNRYATWFRLSLLPLFLCNLVWAVAPVLRGTSQLSLGEAVMNSVFWAFWFVLLSVIARLSGGSDHPPTEPGPLSPARRIIAWITLALFVLLFIPTAPLTLH